MIAVGLTNADVAERLGVTVHAVKFHLGHIYRKLGVTNRTEAAVAFHELDGNGKPVESDTAGRQVVADWNDTAAPYPACCLPELVATNALAAPDAIAVSDGFGKELSYGELERRANKLAHHLRTLGVAPEVLVGIAVSRSASMLVGLLGIMKAGGAYVPIDPSYPAERVAYMLQNAEAPVLVTEEALLDRLPSHDAHVVCIDRDWPAIEREPDTPPENRIEPENLAYVIYTSGSTGNPKGVEIPHRALVNFLWTMRERPGLENDDVLLAVTTLSFDIAGLELYLPLVVGARVVIAPETATANPAELARMIEAFGVTVMQATPTTWRMIVDAGWPGKPGLKALCGGEALPLALADALVDRQLQLWNMYGPTETTIWSTTTRITTRGKPITIGKPIANTTLHVLDDALQPVPIGAEGELHIGGHGVARGYRGRQDLTAERFLPDPFDTAPNARIYKTGDLVRYRADGEVEYIGRLDHQVKVRGFRIELGEIETVLSRHEAVRAAVAMAREDTPGDPRVVAYVIPNGKAANSADLREHVARSLPPYMVPSAIVTLESFPLTPNGKIDRKALPEPTRERDAELAYVAPRTGLEQRLVKIWEHVLDITPIGVTDDFFELGVTSIVAAQLFARIEHELGHDLPLGAVFQAPTIERLAQLLELGEADRKWTSLVPMQPQGSKPPIFCVHGGAGTILHLQPLAKHLGTSQPFYGLQAQGLYGGAPPLLTVEEMARHYLSEMRSVQQQGPYYLAGYCFGTIVAFEIAQLLRREGEDVALLAMFNGPSPAWIKKWGWFANQPSHRTARAAAAPPPLSRSAKVLRTLRSKERLSHWLHYGVWKTKRSVQERFEGPRARLSLALGRPLPEWLREHYFLRINFVAERAYDPQPYPGEILMFSGKGMYEDLELGWGGLAERGIVTYEVPGEHKDNRDVMRDAPARWVADVLADYLGDASPSHAAA